MTNAPFLAIVVGADVESRGRLRETLADQPLVRLVEVDDLDALATVAAASQPHVVVGDASLVGHREVVQDVRRVAPHVGIVVQAHDGLLEDAVLALRARVDEFFPTSVEPVRLREAMLGLAEHAQRRRELAGSSGLVAPLEDAGPAAEVVLGT